VNILGRKKTGQTPVRNFRLKDEDFTSFRTWCKQRGFTVSEALRGLIKFVNLKGDEEE